MAKKDTCLAVLAGKEPTRYVHPDDVFMSFAPGERGMNGVKQPDGTSIGLDWFGCSWTEMPGGGPIDGATITPGTQRLDDLADYKDAIPTPEQVRAFDWQGYADAVLQGFDRDEQILYCRSMTGPFERMHCLIGFEDALCMFYEDPELVEEFFAAMLEYKLTVLECIHKYLKPDIICFDDDYGTMRSTFISPDMWREFFPQYWKPLIDRTHELGMVFELHSCGYITPLVGDFVELGVEVLGPLQTNNDLKYIKETYGDKLTLRLAIFDKQFHALNQTEDQIRADIRGYYEILTPGGRFIPDLVPIADRYYEIQAEVQDEYEKEYYGL